MGVTAERSTRRWWALAAVALLAVIGGGLTWLGSGRTQQSSAVVVVVPPALDGTVINQNPLLDLTDSIGRLAAEVRAATDSRDVTDALHARGATASYRVSSTTGAHTSSARLSPLIVLKATGSSADADLRTTRALVLEARTELASIQQQAEVPAGARATLLVIVPPSAAHAVGTSALRVGGWIFGAILVVGWLSVLADVLLAGRQSRRGFAPPPPTASPAVTRHSSARRTAGKKDRAPRSR